MFNTIRAKLIALVLMALAAALTIGAVGLYGNSQLEATANRAAGYGLAAQNAGLTDMFHDNMRGLVEQYVGAAKDKSPERLAESVKSLNENAKQIRTMARSNIDSPVLNAKTKDLLVKLVPVFDDYAKTAEAIAASPGTDLVELEKSRAEFTKKFQELQDQQDISNKNLETELEQTKVLAADTVSQTYALLMGTVLIAVISLITVAFFIYAMRALRALDIPVASKVVLQLNSDEEVGSHSSRGLTEAMALRSKCVLVLEPGTGLTGKLKTARKGVGGFDVTVHGKAAHAGVDFSNGANAIVELARQIEVITGFTDLGKGLTVSPGVIRGGTRSNVVPAFSAVEVDVRVARLRDAALLERKFRGLKVFDKRCRLEVTGGLNRPPMERTRAIGALFAKARLLAAELGVVLEESSTGGGSDGNFSAALGVPTLDGLGTVGEGAHAANESILIDRIADRTALLAKLVAGL